MSNTLRHKEKNKSKRAIRQYREDTDCSTEHPFWIGKEELENPELLNILYDFLNKPGTRHGNKRRFEAYMKWKKRKKQRIKLNKLVDEIE
jgi:hypothetical protein